MTVRSALPTVYILVAGVALALALAAIPYIGTAGAMSATASEPLAEVLADHNQTPAVTPAELPTVEDVAAPWHRGDYLGAGLFVLWGLFVIGLRVDPKRALIYTSGLAALGGCVDLVANGHTPNSGMLIGSLAVFVALVTRSPLLGQGQASAAGGSK